MLKVINYFRERISSKILGWVLNTSPIFKLLRENLSKFVSYQNKLLARLNRSSRGICSLCNIYMSSLKVIFSFILFFFELNVCDLVELSRSQNMLEMHSLFKLDETFDCYAKHWLPHFSRYFTSHLPSLI